MEDLSKSNLSLKPINANFHNLPLCIVQGQRTPHILQDWRVVVCQTYFNPHTKQTKSEFCKKNAFINFYHLYLYSPTPHPPTGSKETGTGELKDRGLTGTLKKKVKIIKN